MTSNINILISDDKKEICDSIEENIIIEFSKYLYNDHILNIKKSFTDHAFKHGCNLIDEGFQPNICIFDLVFNGSTGVDLYNYIINNNSHKHVYLCIYTGIEKTYHKRKEAEVLASAENDYVTVISKPNISDVFKWFEKILNKEYKIYKKYDENDPFDML